MHLRISACVVSATLLLASAAAAAPRYSLVSSTSEMRDGLQRAEWIVQSGRSELSRFTITAVRRPHGALRFTRGTVILMPGGNANFELYEIAETRYAESFAGALAQAGYLVLGYSPPTKGLTIESGCVTGTQDCSVAAGWGMAATLRNLEVLRLFARTLAPYHKPVIGGLSLGAMTTIAALNEHPQAYAGGILWEGMLTSDDPQVLSAAATLCANAKQALAAGVLFKGDEMPLFKLLLSLAQAAPDEASPIEPTLTNRQLYVVAATSEQPLPAGLVPGYTLVMADASGFDFAFASDALVAQSIVSFNDLETQAMQRDYTCAIAGDETFTANLGAVEVPLFVVRAGHGFGPYMDDTLRRFGARSIVTVSEPEQAHADIAVSANRAKLLDAPLLAWLAKLRH
jgi:alpha-beta hydrolase superfamily lysophospholipase